MLNHDRSGAFETGKVEYDIVIDEEIGLSEKKVVGGSQKFGCNSQASLRDQS